MTERGSAEPAAGASGIYAITHIASGKQYIGSAVNIRRRWNQHRRDLNKGSHHSSHLQRAWDKYGAEAFAFTVLEEVGDVTRLIEREQFHMDARFAARGSIEYNARPNAKNNLGFRHTEEYKAHMRTLMTGRTAWWGYKRRGRKQPRAAVEFNARRRRGTKLSDRWKQHISEGLRRQNPSTKELARRARWGETTRARNLAWIADGTQAKRLAELHSPENRTKAGQANSRNRAALREAFQATMTDDTPLLCRRCKQEKPAREFYPSRVSFSGRQYYCKKCRRAYKREREGMKSEPASTQLPLFDDR